jgi:hypothetical protein
MSGKGGIEYDPLESVTATFSRERSHGLLAINDSAPIDVVSMPVLISQVESYPHRIAELSAN